MTDDLTRARARRAPPAPVRPRAVLIRHDDGSIELDHPGLGASIIWTEIDAIQLALDILNLTSTK